MELARQILEYFTYSPRDLLHFSPGSYFRLFEILNRAVWPAQVAALALGAAMLWLVAGAAHPSRRPLRGLLRMKNSSEITNSPHPEEPPQAASRRVVPAYAILAAAWLCVTYSYFGQQLATIHLAGAHFAWAFVAEAVLLLWFGVMRDGLGPPASAGARRWGGLAILAFALVIQPMVAPILGRPWTQAEIFGIAPDPTVTATLGALAATDFRARPWTIAGLMVLPLAWCAITGVTLWTLNAPEFWLMPVIGAAAAVLVVWGTAASWAEDKRFNHEGTKTRRSE